MNDRPKRSNDDLPAGSEEYEADTPQPANTDKSRRTKERIKMDLLIHDLKVPLVVIEASLHSLLTDRKKYGRLTEKQEQLLSRSLKNTRMVQGLVNDALEIARAGAGLIQVEPVEVSTVVRDILSDIIGVVDPDISEAVRNCRELPKLQKILAEQDIRLIVAPDLWHRQLPLDEAKVKQILRNLVDNALKYRRTRCEICVEADADSIRLSVSDDGEGIPRVYHEKLFRTYFQMDFTEAYIVRGHGIGLAGVQVLVEDMGGSLHLNSDAGEGATFVVTLPLEKIPINI